MPFRTIAGRIAAYAAGLTLGAFWVVAGAPSNWSVSIPDQVHTYGIRNRRGADLFYRPAVGWFIEHGLLVVLAMIAAALVVEVVARRLSRAPNQPAADSTDFRG
jgi:hypothetical protein